MAGAEHIAGDYLLMMADHIFAPRSSSAWPNRAGRHAV
jgi:hypothetical protein